MCGQPIHYLVVEDRSAVGGRDRRDRTPSVLTICSQDRPTLAGTAGRPACRAAFAACPLASCGMDRNVRGFSDACN
jgi:hypothetical protein